MMSHKPSIETSLCNSSGKFIVTDDYVNKDAQRLLHFGLREKYMSGVISPKLLSCSMQVGVWRKSKGFDLLREISFPIHFCISFAC